MSWGICDEGHHHWGPRGAAGLLVAEDGRALLQLRAGWVLEGGTWSVPGGALERRETPVEAAMREAAEELGLDPAAVEVRGRHVSVCGGWTYETVLAVPTGPVVVRDLSESAGHRWVPAAAVSDLPLHPSFRRSWEDPDAGLREFVETGRAI